MTDKTQTGGELLEHTLENTMPTVAAPELSPLQIIQTAVAQGMGPGEIEQLVALQERMEKTAAHKAFVAAMAAFKRNPPQVLKDVDVSFGNTKYKHADLAKVSDVVGHALLDHGLTHTWKTDPLDNGMTKVTCTITHIDGHSESSSMQCAPDQSGGKNAIQAQGSGVTYLMRYTLMAAVGIVAQGADNDGRGATPEAAEFITPEQAKDIEAKIEAHELDRVKFLAWAKVGKISEIQASNLDHVNKAIQKTIDNLSKGAG